MILGIGISTTVLWLVATWSQWTLQLSFVSTCSESATHKKGNGSRTFFVHVILLCIKSGRRGVFSFKIRSGRDKLSVSGCDSYEDLVTYSFASICAAIARFPLYSEIPFSVRYVFQSLGVSAPLGSATITG